MRGERWSDLERDDGRTLRDTGAGIDGARRAVHRLASVIARTRARQERALSPDADQWVVVADSTPLIGDAGAAQAPARAAVSAFVLQLRHEQVPPQRVLVLLKDLVRQSSPPELTAADQRELIEDVVRWTIDAYYTA